MALSREEQGILDGIEQGLREDPSFTAGLDDGWIRRSRRRHAVAVAVPGLVLLVLGEMLAMSALVPGVAISVCGFLAMLVAFAWFSGRFDLRWSPLHSRRRGTTDDHQV